MELFVEVFAKLGNGFIIALLLFVLTLILAIPLGLVMCFCTMSKFKPLSLFSKLIVWVLRGTPLMLQVFAIFYLPGLLKLFVWPQMNTGWAWFDSTFSTRFIAALAAFAINYAAYFSEIYRGGIESIPKGQYEAGQVLGLTKKQVFFKIVLLQVIKRIIPPMSNEIITLIKDTALANTIAVYELIFEAKEFMTVDGLIWPIFAAGGFYLIFVGLLTLLFGRLEKKLDYFKA
ncbi:MAG: amino acid ABC transporter permease [Clostridia bacterium]|nr:amino acid ABC transporter permease [Clostridia bacterium]